MSVTFDYRRATRPAGGRLLGGVAAGLAAHLGVPVLPVRLAFVVTAGLAGAGVLGYALLWRFLPQDDTGSRDPLVATGAGELLALAAVGIGVLLLVGSLGLGVSGSALAALAVGALGVALVWRQADESQRARWSDRSPRVPVLGVVTGTDSRAAWARLVLGGALLVAALTVLAAQSAGWEVLDDVLLAMILGVGGAALLLAPWVSRLAQDLSSERGERVRAQERADVAAHLHDSVLQTLALLQRHADDGRRVAGLARRQERELRAWLYEPRDAEKHSGPGSLRSSLTAALADVEDEQGVPVDLVVVGDTPLDSHVTALVAAAREAALNASRHSTAERVNVFAEVTPAGVDAYIRDRGCGFDPARVPAERLGLRRSIVERMQRHGGEAVVRSSPGEGTEVTLRLGWSGPLETGEPPR